MSEFTEYISRPTEFISGAENELVPWSIPSTIAKENFRNFKQQARKRLATIGMSQEESNHISNVNAYINKMALYSQQYQQQVRQFWDELITCLLQTQQELQQLMHQHQQTQPQLQNQQIQLQAAPTVPTANPAFPIAPTVPTANPAAPIFPTQTQPFQQPQLQTQPFQQPSCKLSRNLITSKY